MLKKSTRNRKDCLEADELMRVISEKVDSNREEAMDAFGKLYDIYKDVLWKICIKTCGNKANADFVFGETWKRILNHPNYDYQKHKVMFVTWMSRIAHNIWIDTLKRSVPIADETIDDIIELEEGEEEVDVEPSFNAKLIEEAMATLTEKERNILKIYLIYDTDKKLHVPQDVLNELRERYQTTPANLRKIKSRALEKVRDYVRKHQ